MRLFISDGVQILTKEKVHECQFVLYVPEHDAYIKADADIVYQAFAERYSREVMIPAFDEGLKSVSEIVEKENG